MKTGYYFMVVNKGCCSYYVILKIIINKVIKIDVNIKIMNISTNMSIIISTIIGMGLGRKLL